MNTITTDEIDRDPKSFIARLVSGESMIVMHDKQPLAEVRPLPQKLSEPRPFGLAAGEFVVPANFDEPLEFELG